MTRETSGNSFSQVYRFIRYTPSAGQIVKLSVDMSRSGSSTTFGYLELNLPDSIGGAATRVGISRLPGAAFSRAFVQAPYNSTTGQFEVGQPLRLVQLGNPLASGQSLRIEAFLNYTTKKIDLKLDGVSATGGYTIPFRNQTSADLNVLGMIASGFGTNDVADADNLKIEVVPEPSSLAVIAVGTLACMRQGRRRSRKS